MQLIIILFQAMLREYKRSKLFGYLKQNINLNGFILFQESHPSLNDGKQWKDVLDDPSFFSHSKTNSCGVPTGFCGKHSFDLINQKNDENVQILIIKAKIN